MSLLFTKKDVTDEEYIIKYALTYLGMKKIKDESVDKIIKSDENKSALSDFNGRANFLFALPVGSEGLQFLLEPPLSANIKKKSLLIIKTVQNKEPGFPTGIDKEIVFMEINRPILENLYNTCTEIFLPILGNPLNQIGWSDLVSKDLMDKFHQFLAYTYVTIGQVKGRTLLPLPPSDVTSSERTSSKDKAHILETAIIHWQKQIKNVLKQDPEQALKSGSHPDPLTELEFWRNKSENLNSICQQLNSERIKKVLKFLEQNKSTYTTPFSKLQKEVQIAQKEANENYKYLKTLEGLFSDLTNSSKDLVEISELFVPIMHTILLIWTHSQNYNTPSRLVVLIREICNAIINQCRNYVDGPKVFEAIKNEDPSDAHQKLTLALDVCSKFKDAYFDYKARSKNQWKITTNALFVRLDAFSERCVDIMHLTGTIQQFNKLQKIEIGNTKGLTMTSSLQQIYNEFGRTVEEFMTVKYDIMNIEKREFDDDFFNFRKSIRELERRLASVLTQSFDDCDTIIGKFKLLDSFEGLLNRPIIQDELERKHVTLLELFKQDLKETQQIFQEGKVLVERVDERSPISSNMPPIAGALNWTRGLFERCNDSMERLSNLSATIQEREEYKDVQKLYNSLCKNLKEFEDQKIREWEAGVEESTEDKLNMFLLYREETELAVEGFVKVNFDPTLVRLLREVKYLKLLEIDLPERASKLYDKVSVYRTQTGNLELCVNMYNEILATLLPVEKPLLADKITQMGNALQPGIETLKWNSENINPFISKALSIVTVVDELVKKMKENVLKMTQMMEKWTQPMYERKGKAMLPEDVETTHTASNGPRLEAIRTHGKEIHKLMKDTFDNIKPDKASKTWRQYVDYLNGLAIEGITNGINASMLYLKDQLSLKYNRDHNPPLQPIFDIKVTLEKRVVIFEPSITCNQRENGIRDIINKIIGDFISLSTQMPRLDTLTGDYLVEIKDQFVLCGTTQLITNNLNEIQDATNNFIHQYDDKKFLWEETLAESFQAFLDSGKSMKELFAAELDAKRTGEEGEEAKIEDEMNNFEHMTTKILNQVVTRFPTLEVFDEKIQHLIDVKEKIATMKPTIDIGWLRVNSTPLIKELERTINNWIEAYTNFLLNNTTKQIQNIKTFVQQVTEGIKVIPTANETDREKQLLMGVMTHLRDVKTIKDKTLSMIEPMKQAILLLKKHQVKMEEGVDYLVILENNKSQLIDVSEKALGPIKEQILPLQNQEAQNIKGRLARFSIEVQEFRIKFQNNCPFHIQDSSPEIIDKAYDTITQYYEETCKMEKIAKDLNNLEGLFDLTKTNYKQLKDCRSELNSLKQMWDLIALIDMQFDSWKKTAWDSIDTDNLATLIKDMEAKQMMATAPQNKVISKWKGFVYLKERVTNMNKVIPLIAMLHSKFMQGRHWKKLERTTAQKIDYESPKFCLEDLIRLQLFKYADEVNEIVEGAQKESKIESSLTAISKTWDDQNFEFIEYKDTYMLGSMETIVEFVETQQMAIMTMMAQKEVEEFKEMGTKWQKTLKAVDNVITIWTKVQRNWQRLEPIFVGSDDIRAQLPEDTKRFEKVDNEWKDLMREARDEPMVVNACTADGREELLNTFNSEIETCEKALNDYLQAKKKIFARFYFVSDQALLDILSNGNNPEKVDEYIGDCFDGLKCVKFLPEGPRPYKTCVGMHAKDQEFVPFSSNFTFVGVVENYLCDLEAKMISTLKEILDAAKITADNWEYEKPRHIWLEDYCAQISLLTTQIMWTEETARAFDDLDGGSETAMKDYGQTTILRINKLIERVRTDLHKDLRDKIITIITIDVHERDVVIEMVDKKIVESSHFKWQSQLKFYMESKEPRDVKKVCNSKICDWSTWYNYEYVGNCGRLVITPLTDRCYITLTQALNLSMGGAPAGPAGTGKTETTKDLGRALGLQVVVFNCSDQMNYMSMSLIFMGLAQTGAWGCFDEFNRISIEVLSVVSTQVKYCLDAIKELKINKNKNMFFFFEEEICIKITVGFWITMNPGYAGRTELPENLKALFRSCAMVVPDIVLICENMLMSEGFQTARDLSKKFMTLYNLAKSLLSQMIHYDWGLRAVKSVLRQAGKLKRADPDISEEIILMRALRDFNMPKIIVDDRSIFLGLIRDLFPGIEAEPKKDEVLLAICADTCKKTLPLPLQAEEGFVKKCVELSEILEVRHSCFLIGNTGSAKSTIWKNLSRANTSKDYTTVWDIVDPKAVTSDELFGCMNPKTREWKDGVLCVMMRDMVKNQGKYKATQKQKWCILDGDVDPEWIESLNTVMDDNKVLTLVSQERIPLTPEMRLILEVSNLKNATPATVSRGGVLYINDSDIGWRPFYDTWMSKFRVKNDEHATNVFTLSLTNFIQESFLDDIHSKETIAPCCDLGYISTLTTIIDYLYNNLYTAKEEIEFLKRIKEESNSGGDVTFESQIKQIYEGFFIFAMIWAFGGPITEAKVQYSTTIKNLPIKTKFPDAGQIFDYYFDPLTISWKLWSEIVKPYDTSYDGLFNNLVVPTAETTRQKFLIDVHRVTKKGMLFIGNAGTGKTVILKDYFAACDLEKTVCATLNFNNYTDSKALQTVIESNVDKRTGKIYGPPSGKILMFFMDDLNMPKVDKYGTQSPICLIRQIIDYQIVFDRDHLEDKKEIHDIMFIACMNPKSGSFNIDLRLTRHFTMIALGVPEKDILATIFGQVLTNHFKNFDSTFKGYDTRIVNATSEVFTMIARSPQFMPTARKFHYQFNLRDFSKITMNLMNAQPHIFKGQPLQLVRMWAHECHRVWLDRLLFPEDVEAYMNMMRAGIKQFPDMKEEVIFEEPLVYTSFVAACKGHEATYMSIKDMEDLRNVLETKMAEYNENVGSMDLVLFGIACEHITRIARIIDQPCGNALLVGVGGSGKQSLGKLTAFILGQEVFRIVVTSNYSMNDLKLDIQNAFTKAGVAGIPLFFILTDSQIPKDNFLVYINDILSAGYIPDLFAKDELDEKINKIRSEAKSQGIEDSPNTLFQFFVDKVRKNLHIGLCFSPVGEAFRVRGRQFPGLINSTTIDWFHEWPEDALVGVAKKFLKDIAFPTEEISNNLASHMAFVHLSISDANKNFLLQCRRYNYTTPTSFLELISFYKALLGSKTDRISEQIQRLETGLETMNNTTNQVAELQKLLDVKMVEVEIKKESTDKLIDIVSSESAAAAIEEDAAKIQADSTNALAAAANETKAAANKELEAAIPAMKKAEEAVKCLDVKAVQELKSLGSPPADCVLVTKAILILKGDRKNHAWPNAQKMMNNPKQFLESLQTFDGNNIDQKLLDDCAPIIAYEGFTTENMKKKSSAAASLCTWVCSIIEYNRIYKNVKPLMEQSDAAEKLANEKLAELAIVLEKVRVIVDKVNELKRKLDEANAEKQAVVDNANALASQLNLANRLVNGLADERVRWMSNVDTYKLERLTMIGNAILSAAFVSYIGPFNSAFRAQLWQTQWLDDIKAKQIPFTDGIDPLVVLSTLSDQAIWKTQGLPADRVSLENAAIVVSCKRYPLLIDPQLQGIKWIKGKEGTEMVSIQLSQKNWQTKVQMALQAGSILMIESIGEQIDAILDPLLSRQFVKKGRGFTVKLGSEDVDIMSTFKLYLQTKLINPHYKPETAAQCTIINFIVTESGLEDQLLAMVVRVEKPDLEQTKEELVNRQNGFQIQLAQLESKLLKNLSDADPNTILQNIALIESLEVTKTTSMEIQKQQLEATKTEQTINIMREIYRRVSAEGAMLYFLLIQLNIVNHMYQYSLESFTTFFFKAIDKTEQFEDEENRVLALRQMIRMTIYQWVSRGLFERHKQIFLSSLTFRIMQKGILDNVEYNPTMMNFLLFCPTKYEPATPQVLKSWLPDLAWASVQKLIEIEPFEQFSNHLEKEAPGRFKDWYNELTPETEKLPLDWKKLENMPFEKLLVIRCLRPDRITTALDNFIRKTLPKGDDFVSCDSTSSFNQVFQMSYADSTTTTPIYFILSPGSNPVRDVETLALKLGFDPKKMLHQVALGQGQDVIANQKLDIGHKEGHWVMLQNVHLMPAFLIDLEKKLDAFAIEGSNPNFRLFLSSDPSNDIPIGLLEKSIKLTNEPPQGLKPNMKRALTAFPREEFEDKEAKIKTILFGLCYFHSVMCERRKFGTKGWNRHYPFSMGDLQDSSVVLQNYMDGAGAQGGRVPWDDLKYIFGDIMYGGHIVDDWDRRFCSAYLDSLMQDSLLDEAEMFPFIEGKNISFKSPAGLSSHEKFLEYIETELPPETPLAFAMHPNAEIDFRTTQCRNLFAQLTELQPKGSGGSAEGGGANDKVVEFISRVNDEAQLENCKFNIDDIAGKLNEETRGPYQNAFMQECECMNVLIKVIVASLVDIVLAFKGELTMSEKMENLMKDINLNKVPAGWEKFAFPSMRGLGSWLDNIKQRIEQLTVWKDDPTKVPKVTFLNRLFNPNSFMTSIKQIFSREHKIELNKTDIQTDILKKMYWEQDLPSDPKDGAYIFGFQVEGARWDYNVNSLEESFPKVQFAIVPVIFARAVSKEGQKDDKNVYKCPVYKTENRMTTYVFEAQMKTTKYPPAKWILAGVALILDVEGVSDQYSPAKEIPLP